MAARDGKIGCPLLFEIEHSWWGREDTDRKDGLTWCFPGSLAEEGAVREQCFGEVGIVGLCKVPESKLLDEAVDVFLNFAPFG